MLLLMPVAKAIVPLVPVVRLLNVIPLGKLTVELEPLANVILLVAPAPALDIVLPVTADIITLEEAPPAKT